MNALTLIQATVEPQGAMNFQHVVDLLTAVRNRFNISNSNPLFDNVHVARPDGDIVLFWETRKRGVRHSLEFAMREGTLEFVDYGYSPIQLVTYTKVARVKPGSAMLPALYKAIEAHKDLTIPHWAHGLKDATATVEPQAMDPEKLFLRVGTQLGWHRDDRDDGAEAEVVLAKKVTDNLTLRVGVDNNEHSGGLGTTAFVEIFVASIPDYFLHAMFDKHKTPGFTAWFSQATNVRMLLTELESKLLADNPKPVKARAGSYDDYELRPLGGFDSLIIKLLRANQ